MLKIREYKNHEIRNFSKNDGYGIYCQKENRYVKFPGGISGAYSHCLVCGDKISKEQKRVTYDIC
jgi:hypothetical protein